MGSISSTIGAITAVGQEFLSTSTGKVLLDTVLLRSTRSFYTGDLSDPLSTDIQVIPDVVVRESHRDSLHVTTHPVEDGADITDHLYRQPSEVNILMGFASTLARIISNNIIPTNQAITPLSVAKDLVRGTLGDTYADLITIFQNQELRPTLFTVVTGKRIYENMVMSRLFVTTDKDTENSLLIDCTFQEIITVDTSSAHLDPIKQAKPQATAEPTSEGNKQVKEDNESILHKAGGFGGIFDNVGKALGSIFK